MSKIISLFGSKGGVGTTFLTVNTALIFASLDKDKSIAILELNTKRGGDLVLLTGLKNPKTLFDILPLLDDIDPEMLKGFFSTDHSKIDVLSMPVSLKDSQSVIASLPEIIKLLKVSYDYVFIDMEDVFNKVYLKAIEESDLCLLVLTPDLLATKGAKQVMFLWESLHFSPELIEVILNCEGITSGLLKSEVEANLGIPIKFAVSYSKDEVLQSIHSGKPLVESSPHLSISRQIKSLSSKIPEILRDTKVKKSTTFQVTEKDTPDYELKKIDEAKIKIKIHTLLVEEMKKKNIGIETTIITSAELKDEVLKTVEKIFSSEVSEIKSKNDRDRLIKEVLDEALGLGPLEDLLKDNEITEIMVNNKEQVYIEKKGKLFLSDKKFISDKQLLSVIERIVTPIGRRIDESVPLVDARLLDGSRVNAVIPPLALKGPSITIRKFSKKRWTIEDLISYGSLSKEAGEFIRICVLSRKNIVISGGTGSGKTTLLNVVSSFIPSDERVITIEDSAELNLPQEHVITLESRAANIEGKGAITIRDLVRNALRMRPDRVVVGECRGGEALDMLQAMNTGHDGSLTTAHSNSPRDTLSRMETMVLMAGMDLPLRAIREQISSAVDLIIHQSRFKDGTRKITHVTEVVGMEGDVITIQDVFLFKQTGIDSNGKVLGGLEPTGIMPSFIEELKSAGIEIDRKIFNP